MVGSYLNNEEKARILSWIDEKIPIKEICLRSRRSERTIFRLKNASRDVPKFTVPSHKPIPGRPRLTSKETDKLLRREVLKNPRLTASELKSCYPILLEKPSIRTLRHRLQKDLQLPSRIASKKPLLTDAMKKKRLAFAKKYKDWTPEQWEKVLWSDESTFQMFNHHHRRVRRPPSISRYNIAYTLPTVKHPVSVMVWGCFSGLRGRGGLFFLPKNTMMNGDRYIRVLKDHMLAMYEMHESLVFQHDSAPCHKAKKVSKFLSDNNIDVLDWPGNSPDLNPIENCWHIMKTKLSERKPTSLEELINEIKNLWVRDMSPDYFKKLAHSMPKRLKLVLKCKGAMTKY